MQRICVFCGSKAGIRPSYAEAAKELGQNLARNDLALVYGGGGVGLMGILADSVLAADGNVIGVIPRNLIERELGHAKLTELRVVDSMHERKAVMAELSDAFIVLPGGAGTMEEFFEVWSWAQLGIHQKPSGLLNVEGYYDPLLAFLDAMVGQGFLATEHRAMVLVERDPDTLLARFASYRAPAAAEWVDRAET